MSALRASVVNRHSPYARLKTAIAILLLLPPCFVRAERLPLKAYTVADGLPNNVVNKIVRDSRGFLWFCTAEGLARFDGYSFTSYGVDQGLPHRSVNDFLETRGGELWVATDGGLALFDPRGEPASRAASADGKAASAPMFTVVLPEDEDRRARAVTVLLEGRDGTIWCGTMKRLYRLERRGVAFSLSPLEVGAPGVDAKEILVNDLLEDRGGSLWVATPDGLFRRRPDGAVEHYAKRDGLPDDTIHDLLEDHEGRLWAATRAGGFFRFAPREAPGSPFVAESYGRQSGMPTDWVFQLYETSDRKFWLATNAGLVQFSPGADRKDQLFRTYTPRSGLSFHEITALGEDAGGNLWLGTNATGAMKLERDGFLTYDEQDGIAGVNAIFSDQTGAVCFRGFLLNDARAAPPGSPAARQQMGRYDGRGFRWFMPEALKKERSLDKTGWVFEQVTLQARDGEWWVGTGEGVYRFPAAENFLRLERARPLALYTTASGLASPQVFRLFEDSAGAIWVSTIGPPNGLARWQGPASGLQDLANSPGLPSPKDDLARSFGEDRAGDVWIGFAGGLARYRAGGFKFFNADDGLPPGAIWSIHPDKAGRLWLASSRSGLIRIDDPTADRPAFKSYTTAEGLSSNGAGVIAEDLQGRIYVGTGRGLDRLDPETGRVVKHFTTADGLASGAMTAAFRDREGALWFGTQKGMSRFLPPPDTSAATAPPILISGLRVAGSQRRVSALGETEISLPDLPPDQNQLQIDFVGLSFAPGEVLRYQYKLEGTDADWSAPTEQRAVNFANLARGRYRFLVRAVTAAGVVSAPPAAVTFTILPHVWQRWWFLTLAAALCGLAAYALYRRRVSRLVELERVRTRIASDLHDDIGSNLSLIAGLSEVLGQQARAADSQMAERLSVIASVSRRSVDAMSDIVWAVNPKRDNLRDLSQRMRRFASDSFTARNIQFRFDAPDPKQNVRVGAEVRREVFLVFKEAVNNIARHSGCGEADISLRIERGTMTLRLSDDGRGLSDAGDGHGHGFDSMRRRAEKLGGQLVVNSRAGAGTDVTLKVPVGRRTSGTAL
jgi:ligand-binding sensor domain-containing protein/signal transduction histidine kinase